MKIIFKILIISIFWSPLTILASCPNGQTSDCETGECKNIEDLKKQYCSAIGDPERFFQEKYEPAAEALNKIIELTKDNPAGRFQNEKLPQNYGINIRTKMYEPITNEKNYLKPGVTIFKDEFPQETVNCFTLDLFINSVKKDPDLVKNPDEMHEIIWNNSCKIDAEKLSAISDSLQILINTIPLDIKTETQLVGPNKDIKIFTSDDLQKYKLEDIKKIIEALYCKYNFANEHCQKANPKKPNLPIIIGAIVAGAGIATFGTIALKNKLQNFKVDTDRATAKFDAAFDELAANEIDIWIASYTSQTALEKAIVKDLAKTYDLGAAFAIGEQGIKDLLLLKSKELRPGEFEEFVGLAKEGEIMALEAKLEALGFEGQRAAKLIQDLGKLAKYKI